MSAAGDVAADAAGKAAGPTAGLGCGRRGRTDFASYDLVLLGDLQLSCRNPNTASSTALARVVGALYKAAQPVRLVLLGDTFELPPPHCDSAVDPPPAAVALVTVADRHPAFFQAVAHLLADGRGWVDVIAGNHDHALLTAGVWEALVAAFDPSGNHRAAIRLHPWYVHIPGIVHAQHGQQFHAMNAHPSLLEPCSRSVSDALGLPLGAHLDRLLGRDDSGPLHRVGVAGAGIRWALAHASARRVHRVREGYRRRFLGSTVEAGDVDAGPPRVDVDLPPRLLYEIDSWSDVTTGRVLTHVIDRRIRNIDYMAPAVARLETLLSSSHLGVACYVCGHTHAPTLERIPGSAAVYGNCGTWSSSAHGVTGAALRVEVRDGRAVAVELTEYDARSQRLRVSKRIDTATREHDPDRRVDAAGPSR